MSTLDWPSGNEFLPRALKWGARTPRSAWQAFYTGQRQSISHLADRMRVTVTLNAVTSVVEAGRREAYFTEIASAGHWLRLWHFHRPAPSGTQRASPTLAANAAAGARTLSVTGTASATLLAGDMLGMGGHLLMVGLAGCTANGAGALTVPLALPLLAAATAGAAITWDKPTGQFELLTIEPQVEYTGGPVQNGLQLEFLQVLP